MAGLDALLEQLRQLQQKESLAEILADPLGRGLAAAALALLFIGIMLLSKPKDEKSELDKKLQGALGARIGRAAAAAGWQRSEWQQWRRQGCRQRP